MKEADYVRVLIYMYTKKSYCIYRQRVREIEIER